MMIKERVNNIETMGLKKGSVVEVDLPSVGGSVQSGKRACLLMGNPLGIKHSPVLILIPLTSKITKKSLPTHVQLDQGKYDMPMLSKIICEQILTVPKNMVVRKLFDLDEMDIARADRAIKISMGM